MRVLLLSALFAASTAWAGPPPAGGAGAEDDSFAAAQALASGRFAEVADRLGLDAGQRTKVSDAVYAANTSKADIDARVEKARLEVRHLLGAETPDDKGVLRAVDALSVAEGDVRRNRVQLVLAIRKVLTPAQWQQLSSVRHIVRTERHERWEEREEEGDDD